MVEKHLSCGDYPSHLRQKKAGTGFIIVSVFFEVARESGLFDDYFYIQ